MDEQVATCQDLLNMINGDKNFLDNKYVKKILFLQSQNTTKHKTKFITILQQHVSA